MKTKTLELIPNYFTIRKLLKTFNLFLIGICLSFSQESLAQKEYNNWYFGKYAAVSFNTNPPSFINNSKITTEEGVASISTKAGRLLFYTNGYYLMDSTHTLMPNSIYLQGGASSTQSALIVPHPDPDSISLYYIFCVGIYNSNLGLTYSMVDMRLNNGKGDVILSKRNVPVVLPTAEKLTGIRHANGKDYWIVVQKSNSDTLYSYKLTAAGLDSVPVKSKTGLYISVSNEAIGYMKLSSDGRKIAGLSAHKDTAFVADFNTQTGKCSNFWIFRMPGGYGLEFSPKTNYLYIGSYDMRLYQFNMRSVNKETFLSSKFTIDSVSNQYMCALQLGPDGKIYYSPRLKWYLGSISYPDSFGFKSQPNQNAVNLYTTQCNFGLPNIIQSNLAKQDFVASNFCINDTTRFSINRSDLIDSAHWDFGDSSSGSFNHYSGFENIVHVYKKHGTYIVKAYFFSGNFVDTLEKVLVFKNFKPDLGKDTAFCRSFLYRIEPTKPYFEYLWSNGSKKNFITVSKAGLYTLTVLDSSGCFVSDSMYINDPRLTPGFELSDTLFCANQSFINLKDTSIYLRDERKTLLWDMGDGTKYTDSQFTKKYADSGLYTIKLKIISRDGCRDSVSKTVRILSSSNGEIIANTDTQCFNEHVFDFNFQTTDIDFKYNWNTGLGQMDSLDHVDSVIYGSSGMHTVYLYTINGNGCKDTFEKSILLWNNPVSRFNVNQSGQCFVGNEFEFTNTSIINNDSIVKLKWQFSDAYKDSSDQFKHSFLSEDTFQISLISISKRACTDTIIQDVITYPSPVVEYMVPNDSQCWRKNYFNFINKTKLKTGELINFWNFGDGTSDTSYSPSNKKYANRSADYTISYYASTKYGCIDSAFHKVSLLERPIADFEINDSIQCFNMHSFDFANQSTFSAPQTVTYYWDYDNGDTSIGKTAKTVSYSTFGYKNVQLIAYSYLTNCYDTLISQILVAPHPIADFELKEDSLCLNGNEFETINKSTINIGSFTNTWYWGDSNKDTSSNGTHTYNTWNLKVIQLKTESEHQCWDSVSKPIMVMPNPISQYDINDSIQCFNAHLFDFISKTTLINGSLKNEWIIDTFDRYYGMDLLNKKFGASLYHWVQLNSYSDFGCKDSVVKRVFIESDNQSRAYHLSKDSQCFSSNNFNFEVKSINPNVKFNSYKWEFGDNKVSTDAKPNHVYTDSGNYEVLIETISENGCLDTSKLSLVVLPQPEASFVADTPCFSEPTYFVNTTEMFGAKISNVKWEFGDGSNSLKLNPEHLYMTDGIHNVRMEIESGFGCKSILNKDVWVRPRPKADFDFKFGPDKDAVTSTLQMSDWSSSDVNQWHWSFDGSDTSIERNPIAYFRDSNSRSIILVVTNGDGCKDTIEKRTGPLFTKFILTLPTAFSPDGNNINDKFSTIGSPYVTDFEMQIFNRWGEIVFKTNDILDAWDGTFMGKPCAQGVYICKVFVVPVNGELETRVFTFTLLR